MNPSKHTIPYSTLLQATNPSYPHWNRQMFLSSSTLQLCSRIISSAIPSWDVLIASNVVNIVTWGGIPVKVGVLYVLFQVNFDVQILIKEEESWAKIAEKKKYFKYHCLVCMFHMLPQSNTFSHGLCLNNFLQVFLIFNQRDQVTPFWYINQAGKISHLVIVMKVIGDMKYLMRSVKRAADALGIWTE